MKDRILIELLKNKNFVKLWLAQMLSQFSIQIITFFILTTIFEITKSTVAVSLMWLAGSLPAIIFGPFSGAVVDNMSRRKLLMFSALSQAVVVLSLLFYAHRVFLLYIVVFVYWFLDQVYYPSQQATAPSLVKKHQLPVINALFLLTQQVSIVVGFGLGGVMLSLLGRVPTIVFASVNLGLASLIVSRLPHDHPGERMLEKGIASFFQDFVEGYKYIKERPQILSTIGTIIGTQVVITIISTSLPGFAREVLGISLNDASVALIVPAGIGAVIATFFLPSILKKTPKHQVIQFGWFVGSISLLLLFGLSFAGLSRLLLAIPSAIGLGIAATSIIVPAQSLLQEKTPDHLRGRVYGQLGFLLILSTTIPLIASAAIADVFGVGALMGFIGLLLLIGLIVVRRKHIYELANSIRI